MTSKVITFQITPYNDSVSHYVNHQLPNIYTIFDGDAKYRPDILTAALSSISEINDFYPDLNLFSSNLNNLTTLPYVHLITSNGTYRTHIYSWKINNVTNIIGFNGDILHFNSLIDSIMRSSDSEFFRYIQPPRELIPILITRNFFRAKSVNFSTETKWMFDNTNLGGLPLTHGLILREQDYIFHNTQ